ncbi:MAG: hypothetical protein BAA01_15265 [Bacillus thermozeamaize]|uniref:Spore coat protein D n=1 Tax=Bacillus thermozeamaize TaxID=230954 RepID=A0A1Y3PII9_9BACI|nr:MAG: hypothetical protein BAA01_15265 [Bacillus thermozeamaize]
MVFHRPMCCSPQSVTNQPARVYRNVYHPHFVNVIQPIEIVTRHHCCPIPRRVFVYQYRDEFVTDPRRRRFY